MQTWDYKDGGLLRDGYLNGLGISLIFHVLVFLLTAAAPWAFPSRPPTLPMCTVDLLDIRGGGSPEGEEGPMGKGNGEQAPAAGAQIVAAAPEPRPDLAPEEPEVVEDAVPLQPVPKVVEKPKEKPKPKTQPKLKPKPTPVRQVAKADTASPPFPREPSIGASAPAGAAGGQGEGAGLGEGEGSGKGNSGDGAGGGGPFDTAFGSGDGPRFASKALPRYPRLAREIGKEGTVLLRVTIDEHGKVLNVEVLKAVGSGFDEEAVRVVKESKFLPARKHGKPIMCRANLPIRFVLTRSQSN